MGHTEHHEIFGWALLGGNEGSEGGGSVRSHDLRLTSRGPLTILTLLEGGITKNRKTCKAFITLLITRGPLLVGVWDDQFRGCFAAE